MHSSYRYVIHQLVILGVAAITEGMATVVINDLQCGVIYNIIAEGMLNETLVGSRSSHGSIAPRPCPMISSECETFIYKLVYIILCTIISDKIFLIAEKYSCSYNGMYVYII